jgi:hypothetical protein
MSRKPKDGATEWTLKVSDVPIDLYWQFHDKAQSARMEFGKWVLKALKDASEEELPAKKNGQKKRAKS